MKRRTLLVGLWGTVLGAPLASFGQSAKTAATSLRRVAVLGVSTRTKEEPTLKPFFDGMRELGWIDGQNIVYERLYADDDHTRLPALAADLVKRSPEAIFAPPVPAALAAAQATRTTPVVFSLTGDPVALGLVKSLARPGGNVTGVTFSAESLSPKRLEILRELLPKAVRIGIAFDPNDAASQLDRRVIENARAKLGFVLIDAPVGKPQELDSVVGELLKQSPDAVVMLAGTLVFNLRHRILELAARSKCPVVGNNPQTTADGALFSYSPSLEERIRRGAYYVDRILKGTRPEDLPVEQLSKLELIINRKAAKALGITIPQSILQRADRVIE